MLKLLCLTQKNRGELLLNDADIKHQGEASRKEPTDQMLRPEPCWGDLLGRIGNAAKHYSGGSDCFFMGRVVYVRGRCRLRARIRAPRCRAAVGSLSYVAAGVLVAASPLLVVMGGGSLVAPADRPPAASGATPLLGAPAAAALTIASSCERV